jgi:hypothetical protein
MQRNGQKRDKKIDGKRRKEKSFFSQLPPPKVFDMDFPQKVFFGVFDLPLLRNAFLLRKKISKKKKKREVPTYLIYHQIYDIRRFHSFFFGAPKGPPKKKKKKTTTKKKIWRKATDRLFLFFFFKVPLLSAMRVGCGHATADGHPQLAAGSFFAS